MLFVGAAVTCGIASVFPKDAQTKQALRIGAGVLWSFNILETLFSSSFSYLGNAKTQQEAEHTMARMRKMAPEVV